tara:strand:+ start:2803 stop:3378 length:576 start_codon:yes stop_codon:yes gene_type:complete
MADILESITGANSFIYADKKLKIIQFTGDIDSKSVHSLKEKFLEMLPSFRKNDTREITLNLQSDGGCLFSALGMYDWLIEFKDSNQVNINTNAHGLVASAATIIYLSGDKRSFGRNSFMLIHSIMTQYDEPVTMGFETMKQSCLNDTLIMKKLIEFYNLNSNIPMKLMNELMKKDIYLTYDDVIKYKIAHS